MYAWVQRVNVDLVTTKITQGVKTCGTLLILQRTEQLEQEEEG